MSSAYKEIPLTELKESKLNPRQHFDAKDMAELTDSVKAKGVLQPVLVRQNGSGFELVAGARRFRAALAAGLATIPAMLRELTDQEALEIMVIENSQRKDVHPLEEAHGYRSLMATYKGHGDKAVDVIAGKVGKSAKYVYDRVKLCALIPEAQKLFLADHFTAGHAILLARLSTADQKRVLGTEDHDYDNGGLFSGPRRLNFTPEEQEAAEDNPLANVKAVSVRELQAYIDDKVRFDKTTVEPMLFPETADTLHDAQQKKTKVIQITHDTVTDQDAKAGNTERIYSCRSWTRADGKHGSKPCARSVLGVIVAGPGRGQAFDVCTDKHQCMTHYGKEIKEREKRALVVPAKAGTQSDLDSRRRGNDGAGSRAAQQQQYDEARKRQEAERKRWESALPAILKALAASVKKAPTKAAGLLGQIIVQELRPWRGATNHVPLGTTAEDLVRHVVFVILAEEAMDYNAATDFPTRMKAFGLDAKKILDQAAPLPVGAQFIAPKISPKTGVINHAPTKAKAKPKKMKKAA
jgi:ParB/RepB/Spo0J family partition protein